MIDQTIYRILRHVLLVIAALVAGILMGLLTGCSSRSATASVAHTTGMQGEQAVDLTTVTRQQTQTESGPDLAALIGTAVKGATGDLSGAVARLAERPPAPSADELLAIVQEQQPGGINGTTGGALGAAGGIGLLLLREWLAARTRRREEEDREGEQSAREEELRRDRDEGWRLAHENALRVPPKAEA